MREVPLRFSGGDRLIAFRDPLDKANGSNMIDWQYSEMQPGSENSRGSILSRSAFAFGHARAHKTGDNQPLLIGSYHPSQQNTSAGRLTESMLLEVFDQPRRHLGR